MVDNGSLYPALQRSSPAEMDCRAVEDFSQWAPRKVLQPNARRAEGTAQGNVEVAAIHGSHGEDSGAGGMRAMRQWWSKIRRALGEEEKA